MVFRLTDFLYFCVAYKSIGNIICNTYGKDK